VPQVATADHVESGKKFDYGPPGLRVADESHRALAQRRPFGVAFHRRLDDLRQSQFGSVDHRADRLARTGVCELLVVRVQIRDAALPPLLAGISRHEPS
jgi:hypothetical protein